MHGPHPGATGTIATKHSTRIRAARGQGGAQHCCEHAQRHRAPILAERWWQEGAGNSCGSPEPLQVSCMPSAGALPPPSVCQHHRTQLDRLGGHCTGNGGLWHHPDGRANAGTVEGRENRISKGRAQRPEQHPPGNYHLMQHLWCHVGPPCMW